MTIGPNAMLTDDVSV